MEAHIMVDLGLLELNHMDRAAKASLGSTPLSIHNLSIVQVSKLFTSISSYKIGSAMG